MEYFQQNEMSVVTRKTRAENFVTPLGGATVAWHGSERHVCLWTSSHLFHYTRLLQLWANSFTLVASRKSVARSYGSHAIPCRYFGNFLTRTPFNRAAMIFPTMLRKIVPLLFDIKEAFSESLINVLSKDRAETLL